MTRVRMYGSDPPILAWIRRQDIELPSSSPVIGVSVTDVDFFIHRYKSAVDSQGTREVQTMMMIEAKSRNGEVPFAQLDTLVKVNEFLSGEVTYRGQIVRGFGVGVLYLSGTDPDDSEQIKWGRFVERPMSGRVLTKRTITKEQFIKLLQFEIHPDTLSPNPLRRHHKTQKITQRMKAPLGFEFEQIITKRS